MFTTNRRVLLGTLVVMAGVLSVVAGRRLLSRITMSAAKPPVAKRVPHIVYFGKDPRNLEQQRAPPGETVMDPPKTKEDEYYWMRDDTREDAEVLGLIKAENAYCESVMAPLKKLQDELYDQMLSRLKETDEDVPYRHGPYVYYSRTVKGLSYKIFCRKKENSEGEEIVLDENDLAKGHEYSVVDSKEVSPSHKLLAYSVDRSGDEHYTLQFKDLETGALLPDVIEDTSGSVEWAADNRAVFYMKQDAESRPFELWMHVLGTDPSADVLLLREDDALFWMGIGKTADERFLVVSVESKETSEVSVLPLLDLAKGGHKAQNLLHVIEPRTFGLRYEVESHKNDFLITTNHNGARNNKLVRAPIASPGIANWQDLRPYDPSTQVDGVQSFESFVAIFGRQNGLEQVWTAPAFDPSLWVQLQFTEPCYSVWAGENAEYTADKLRLVYSSLTSPRRVIEYKVKGKVTTTLKEQEVPSYDPSLYVSCRASVVVRDGTKVPVSLVLKRALLADPSQKLDGSEGLPKLKKAAKCLLYGYGSYAACMDPTFDFKRVSLLDRDIVFAIAHIRGGGEMGRGPWYEEGGKYCTKLNTFNDFADCARGLIASGLTSSSRMGCLGRSAGGLLVGAVVNRDGDLFKCAVADVPFVDVITTMADSTIPLTTGEWEEWGCPNSAKVCRCLRPHPAVRLF